MYEELKKLAGVPYNPVIQSKNQPNASLAGNVGFGGTLTPKNPIASIFPKRTGHPLDSFADSYPAQGTMTTPPPISQQLDRSLRLPGKPVFPPGGITTPPPVPTQPQSAPTNRFGPMGPVFQ